MAFEFGARALNFQDRPDDRNVAATEPEDNCWQHCGDSMPSEMNLLGEKKFLTSFRRRPHMPTVIHDCKEPTSDFPSKHCISAKIHGIQEDFRVWPNLESNSAQYVFDDTASWAPLTQASSPRPPSLRTSDGGESNASDVVPALVPDSAQSRSTSPDSVNTGLASYLGGVHLQTESGNRILSLPHPLEHRPCIFHLFDCHIAFRDLEIWRTHILSHFRGLAAPNTAHCPYCPWETSNPERGKAWDSMLLHVWNSHSIRPGSVELGRPDFDLLRYMWNRRIINDIEYMTLLTRAKAWFYKPKGVTGNFLPDVPCKKPAKESRHLRPRRPLRRPLVVQSPVTDAQMSPLRGPSRPTHVLDHAESNDPVSFVGQINSISTSSSELRRSRGRSRNRSPTPDRADFKYDGRASNRSCQEAEYQDITVQEHNLDKHAVGSGHSGIYQFNESLADAPDSLVERTKRSILGNLMEEFYVKFGHLVIGGARTCANSSDNDVPKAPSSTSTDPSRSSNPSSSNGRRQNTRPPSRKRGREGDDQSPGERTRPTPGFGSSRRLACPFHKHDPVKYTSNSLTGSKYRTCAGPGFETVSRVKEHLYRNHTTAVQCPRCCISFKDFIDLKLHLNQETRCEARESEEKDGVTAEQLEKLKFKKRAPLSQTDVSRWNEIYSILFPGEAVPSPYYDWDVFEDAKYQSLDFELQCFENFKEYSRIYLPIAVESQLERFLFQELEPLRDKLKGALNDAVKSSISYIYEDWENKRKLASSQGKNQTPQPQPTADPPLLDQPDLELQNSSGVNRNPFFQELPLHPYESFAPPLVSANSTHCAEYSVDPSDSGYANQQLFGGYQENSNNDVYLPELWGTQYNQNDMAIPGVPKLTKPPEWQFDISSFTNCLSEDEGTFFCSHQKGKGNAISSAPIGTTVCALCQGAV